MTEGGPKNTTGGNPIEWKDKRKTLEYQKRVVSILRQDLVRALIPNFSDKIKEEIDLEDEDSSMEETLEQIGLSVQEVKTSLDIAELETIGDVRAYCREKRIDQKVITKRIAMIEKNWGNISAHLESGKVWNDGWVIEFREESSEKTIEPEQIN